MFFPFFNCISLCIPCPDIQETYHRNAKHNTETQDQPKMNLIVLNSVLNNFCKRKLTLDARQQQGKLQLAFLNFHSFSTAACQLNRTYNTPFNTESIFR
ncbi:hypothetical protein T4A_6678 [Trichinella pseudospiralis]|uniref:Uncharacterized protein n=1 Tax=Trichinella pseudospiralis TaxID=6337 RepID=A0A0V1ELK1_TRIPS|nr:hypothetical protein T4A_6678 [Trichinella pseudospiralis]